MSSLTRAKVLVSSLTRAEVWLVFAWHQRSSASKNYRSEEVEAEGKEQVIELGQSDDEFGAFDRFDPSEDPSDDLGDPSLTEADL